MDGQGNLQLRGFDSAMQPDTETAVAMARDRIARQWPVQPAAAVILGTGLGRLVEHVQRDVTIPFAALPGFPPTTALGHRGRVICGRLNGIATDAARWPLPPVRRLQLDQVTLPVRVLHACGARLLIASNASGGLNPEFAAGDIMVIDDHINLMTRPVLPATCRTVSLVAPSARVRRRTMRSLQEQVLQIARRNRFVAHRGVYVAMTGPNYETRAEYRFLRRIGGDVVGMSTVPEVVVAQRWGCASSGLSIVTNVASPDAPQVVDATDVVDAAAQAEPYVRQIVAGIVELACATLVPPCLYQTACERRFPLAACCGRRRLRGTGDRCTVLRPRHFILPANPCIMNTEIPPSSEPTERRWRPLTAIQRRVAGVLVEKAKTTPDAYPLTLNALTNGCNQKSNRSPHMDLSSEDVERTVEELREMGAVAEVQSGGRVPKFRHYLYEWLGVDKVELAVIAELLLRGEQTIGELRGHASRMEPIADLNALHAILEALVAKELVVLLTPPGRGQMVTHNLYTPERLEELKASSRRDSRRPNRLWLEFRVPDHPESPWNSFPHWSPKWRSCGPKSRGSMRNSTPCGTHRDQGSSVHCHPMGVSSSYWAIFAQGVWGCSSTTRCRCDRARLTRFCSALLSFGGRGALQYPESTVRPGKRPTAFECCQHGVVAINPGLGGGRTAHGQIKTAPSSADVSASPHHQPLDAEYRTAR